MSQLVHQKYKNYKISNNVWQERDIDFMCSTDTCMITVVIHLRPWPVFKDKGDSWIFILDGNYLTV